jgi:hypothetical protein
LPALHGALDGAGGAVRHTATRRGTCVPRPGERPRGTHIYRFAALHRALPEYPERGYITLIDDERQRRPRGDRMTRSLEIQHHPP